MRIIMSMIVVVSFVANLQADAFDLYTLPILQKVPESASVKPIDELTSDLIINNSQVLPGLESAMLVVYTNDNRWAKLLVTAARQKIQHPGMEAEFVPMLRIDRYVTFREGSERAVQASGQNLSLFPGFQLHLDLGQIVPAKLGGDITVLEPKPKQLSVKAVGKAKMYLVTKPLPGVEPKGIEKLTIGDKFESKFFAGTYKLYDDGRRTGTLRLKLEGEDIVGTFLSDQNGREYEVAGSIAKPNYKIIFVVKLPQTQQQFEGFMFTGNGKAIAGTSKLQEREAGFYAVRVE